jgi:putative ATP-dependent endonuclease of the OLD family
MFLARLRIRNFRILKDADIIFHNGLNVLLGENDSGKSAIIDAIRLLLGTRDYERNLITVDDFFVDQNSRSREIYIEGVFKGISDEEVSLFLEWANIESSNEDGSLNYELQVKLRATRKEHHELANKYDREIRWDLTAGPDQDGSQLTQDARDFLRATYLKPLRDAELELAARRGSRLSQILLHHPVMLQQDINDDASIPGIVRQANDQVKNHPAISQPIQTLNQDYLANFTLGSTSIQASVDISDPQLRTILEHLELTLSDGAPFPKTRHGLGLNNLLFMATELLLLQSTNSPAPLVMIEEPEAHLHPQFQLRLINFLEKQVEQNGAAKLQVLMTSHSPNLASKISLEKVLFIQKGKAYPMGAQFTMLDNSDYRFLQKFLDVTKANLFFARGILIVEGEAEQILLPTIATLIGRPLEQFGVTIINVGHVGLFRYARIFQRRDGAQIGIPVSCITDLDIPSPNAIEYLHRDRNGNHPSTYRDLAVDEINEKRARKIQRATGGDVQTFVSPYWTLEHDLCMQNQVIASLVNQAIKISVALNNMENALAVDEINRLKEDAQEELTNWLADGADINQISAHIYKSLYLKQASKVETAQQLSALLLENYRNQNPQDNRSLFPQYLVDAIERVTN